MLASDCLSGLLGLSAAGSACFPLPVSSDPTANNHITASTSGLYLDRVEGLSLKPAQNQQPSNEVYAKLANARDQAIPTVANELSRSLSTKQGTPSVFPSGILGGLGDGTLLAGPARLALPLLTQPSTAWHLFGVQLYTDSAASDIPLLLNGVEVARISSNTGVYAPLNLTLPFDGTTYTLEAVLPEGIRAKNNKLTCGCANPWVKSVSNHLQTGTNVKMSAGGFAFQVEEVCTVGPWLCYAMSQNTDVKQSVAFALQYKAAELLLVSFLADAGYSRYTSLDQKGMQALAERCNALYQEHVTWMLGEGGIALFPHPCYSCQRAHYTKSR